jgi:FkbM family methyltransferase
MQFLYKIKWKIKKFFWFFNIDIIKKKKNFDDIYKIKVKKKPIIFDVGANNGQTIQRFVSIFIGPIIHSFEPIKDCCDLISKNYQSKNIFINNHALGKRISKKIFYINQSNVTSSFLKVNNKYKFKKSYKQKKIIKTNVITLDNYIKLNNIKKIDILKIDTQGSELEVLKGANNAFKNKIIKFIELEIIVNSFYKHQCKLYEIDHLMSQKKFNLYYIDEFNYDKEFKITQFDLLYINTRI